MNNINQPSPSNNTIANSTVSEGPNQTNVINRNQVARLPEEILYQIVKSIVNAPPATKNNK